VAILLQALDTLDARAKRSSSAAAVDATSADFLSLELLGLARRLAGGVARAETQGGSEPQPTHGPSRQLPASPVLAPTASNPMPTRAARPPRLEELRAADRAFERLVLLTERSGPLNVGELVITQQELLFQLAQQARAIGSTLMRDASSARDAEAALFYYSRAMRKLRLAGIPERDDHMVSLRRLMAEAEARAENLKATPPEDGSAHPSPRNLTTAPAGEEGEEQSGACVLS
jgi:hypothetical protein